MATTAQRSRAVGRPVDRHKIAGRLRVLVVLTAVLDVVVLSASILLAARWHPLLDRRWASPDADQLSFWSAGALVVVWVVGLAAQGGYNVRNFGAGPEEFRALGQATVGAAGIVGMTCFLLQLPLSRGFVILAFLIGGPLLVVARYAGRKTTHGARVSGHLMRRVIAVGGPSGISEVVEALRRSRYVGYEVVGACLPVGIAIEPERFAVPIVGRVKDTRRLCDDLGADTVLVARGGFDSAQELRRIAWELEGTSIDLVVVPSVTDVAGPRIHVRPVAGLPLLHVEQPQSGKAGGITKRLFDLLFAGSAVVVLAPLFLVVAAVVKLQDGGPVLFRQCRIGRDGRPFEMLKLRSMVVGAELHLESLRPLNESNGLLFKMKDDPRITPVGRVLRRYSVDELPQLLNVLRGEMSLVGPRPPLPSEVDLYADDVHRRLLVRPGLTGLWQVSGRSGLSWDESVRLDLYYVDNWSMTSDLVIIAKTVRAVLGKTGAY